MNELHFSKRYTPKYFEGKDDIFTIPIYQRLFEWDVERIEQLLGDLKKSYLNSKEDPAPYYIGMLTSNAKNELIDGQQRFTVMMLLGIAMLEDCPEWGHFLRVNDGLRLSFPSRTDDNRYLMNVISGTGSSGYANLYMERGISCIRKYIEKEFSGEKKAFSKYVYENLSFFISRLPQEYSSKALNKYFETMNSTGKNLANHEILKVNILRLPTHTDKAKLAEIWNAVSDMDQRLIRRRSNKENQNDLDNRFRTAYQASADRDVDLLFNSRAINKLSENKISEDQAYPAIQEIKADPSKPAVQRLSKNNGFHSIISFTEFLLQVLWLILEDNRDDISTDDFFDVNKLQKTFEKYWSHIDPDSFVLSLLRYRLLYDRYVVSISNDDSSFDLELSGDGNEDDEGNTYHENLLMYEAMLYVNSSAKTYYLWLPDLLKYVDGTERTCSEIYEYIRNNDETRHPYSDIEDEQKLSYNVVDRYWFWKLDFIIWQKRRSLFPDENIRLVADHYSFRRARSIEHIAPQTPDENSNLRLEGKELNCFGNLVMISSAQNSGLSNSTFEMKRAKVQSHIKKELNGTIESLKMLMIYQYDEWNEETIRNHEEACIPLLLSSGRT